MARKLTDVLAWAKSAKPGEYIAYDISSENANKAWELAQKDRFTLMQKRVAEDRLEYRLLCISTRVKAFLKRISKSVPTPPRSANYFF